ncbi:hypothetical protein HYU23_03305 [Candidatus Woesearchaeota archaeon]|nr:hypothetical protein [Candidatus Woesearchaeota archaeon]
MKIKNLILVFILVSAFFIVFNVSLADGCCLKTKGNQYCVSEKDGASALSCNDGLWVSEDCDKRTECATKGCCFSGGNCYENYPQFGCTSSKGDFSGSSECRNTPQCGNVCCKADLGYLYTTRKDCQVIGGEEDADVTDEPSCKAKNYGIDGSRTCCLFGNGTCSRQIEDSCVSDGGTPFKGLYCRDVSSCIPKCTGRHHTGLGSVGDESNKIYWYDSCGNQEDIVDESDPIESFRAAGFDKTFNGDCSLDPSKIIIRSSIGQFGCANLVCENVWDNPRTDENHNNILNDDKEFGIVSLIPSDISGRRKYRYNNESWCEYMQAKVGPGLDLPGTRHYIHYCDRGKEKVYVEGEGRDFICTESILDKKVVSSDGQITNFIYSKASWIKNDWGDCLKCNELTGLEKGQEQTCCNTKKHCSFVFKKPITGENKGILFVAKDALNNLQEVRSQANVFFNIRYWKDSILVKEQKFSDAVVSNKCDDNDCQLEIKEPPAGNYRVSVHGRGCKCALFCICREREVDIGEHKFLPDVGEGLCIPLVPPSLNTGDPNKNSCLTENYGFLPSIKAFEKFNSYSDLPYNTLSNIGGCQSTEECRKLLLKNELKPRIPVLLVDDLNSLCRTSGDCGNAANLAGNVTTKGFLVQSNSYSSESSEICFGFLNNPKCFEIPRKTIIDIEIKKHENLLGGNPTRPEDFSGSYVFFLLPFSFSRLRKRFNRKHLIVILIVIHLILISCAKPYIGKYSSPVHVNCTSWEPPFSNSDCWKCNKKISENGLLPDVDLSLSDGKPAYKCTNYMCWSLGACSYVEDTNGSYCVPKTKFSKPKVEFTSAKFVCSTNIKDKVCSADKLIINNDAGNPSAEIPGYLEDNTALDINFKTLAVGQAAGDTITNCKYSFSEDMINSKDLPSPDGGKIAAVHTLRLAPLVNKPEDYNVFVTCSNAEADESNKAHVKFRVAKGKSIGAPLIYNVIPDSGNIYVKNGMTTKLLHLNVLGDVIECRWDNKSVSFIDMGNITKVIPGGGQGGVDLIESKAMTSFGCDAGGDIQNGGKICSATVTNVKIGENKYWFACQGINGLASQPYPTESYLVKGTNKLEISSITCLHSLGETCDKIYDNNFTFSIKTNRGAEEGKAKCKFAVDEFSYDVFTEPAPDYTKLIPEPTYGTLHKKTGYQHKTGLITVKFLCNDVAGNTAQTNLTISIERDEIPPKIIKSYRFGNELHLQTNELTKCHYINENINDFTNSTNFDTDDGFKHTTKIDSNFYRVRCEDKFNNKRDLDIYISKL